MHFLQRMSYTLANAVRPRGVDDISSTRNGASARGPIFRGSSRSRNRWTLLAVSKQLQPYHHRYASDVQWGLTIYMSESCICHWCPQFPRSCSTHTLLKSDVSGHLSLCSGYQRLLSALCSRIMTSAVNTCNCNNNILFF